MVRMERKYVIPTRKTAAERMSSLLRVSEKVIITAAQVMMDKLFK